MTKTEKHTPTRREHVKQTGTNGGRDHFLSSSKPGNKRKAAVQVELYASRLHTLIRTGSENDDIS